MHDAEGTLPEALACCRAQTLTDHETLLVLNGVTDSSGAIAAEAAAADARVRVLELPDADLVAALNAGLHAARAPLVARFDADDLMSPERLARQVAALDADPSLDVVTCAVTCTAIGPGEPGAGMLRFVAWLNGLATHNDMAGGRFIDIPVAHPAVTFRRDRVLALGGYRAGDFPEDHDLWLRLFEADARFGRVPDPEPLVDWRDRPDRLTRTAEPYRDVARRAHVHRFLLSGPLAGGRPARIWGAGPFGKRRARELTALGVTLTDLLDIDPRKVGRTVAGGLPVTDAHAIGPPDERLVLLCVGSPGARAKIEAFLADRGYQRERDYLALH